MSYVRSLMGIIFGLVIVAAILYVSKKLSLLPLPLIWRHWFIVLIVVVVGTLIVMMASVPMNNATGTTLYRVSGLLVAYTVYFLLSLLLMDGVGLLLPLAGLTKLTRAAVIALIVTGYGIWHAFDTKVVSHTFAISGLSSPITAVHLTDTHFGHARGLSEAQKIVRMINEIGPDLIFFTGDMFDSRRALHEDIFAAFTQIQAPIYFIEGNHDVHVDVAAIKQAMREHGVNVLENEITQFGELTIIGLNHMAADAETHNVHVRDNTHTVQSVLQDLSPDPDAPTVLLHHSPDGLNYAAAAGADLFLAGHTHAGQMFPITLLAKQLFTYNRGRYVVDGMDAYICSGTGTFGPVVRVATRSEICVLELVPEE